jgi:alpha-L-fucosidase
VNIIPLSPDVTPEALLELAAQVTPSERQKAWQRLELTAFIHFGVNTFTDVEWGSGLEDPAVFNPTDLDARQWVGALAAAGFRLVILTVKHHDGFCLWPSRYTDFSVQRSPWKGGNGDVFRELVQAASEFGLKVGVYLSPADLHEMEAPGGRYGNNSPAKPVSIPTRVEGDGRPPQPSFTFTADDYNAYFLNQLYELLTEYGPVHEVWFDGANPKPGVQETYNYDDWFTLVRALAPQAVIFNGPDVRWVGNEVGIGRETEWSVLPFHGDPSSGVRSLDALVADLGSQERLTQAAGGEPWSYLAWSPAEVDVSIRPGWFYHAAEDQRVKPLAHLLEIYYASVGRNCLLLLNIPPDRRGRFADPDVQHLAEFGAALRSLFAADLAQGSSASASSTAAGAPGRCCDGNPDTFWMPEEADLQPELVLQFDEPITFDHIVLQESLDVGQRVEQFCLEAWGDGAWHSMCQGTTIGYKRIMRCSTTQASQVRLRILQSRLSPGLAGLALYLSPQALSA